MLNEDRINLNVPSLAIYSTDYLKLGRYGTFGAIRLNVSFRQCAFV